MGKEMSQSKPWDRKRWAIELSNKQGGIERCIIGEGWDWELIPQHIHHRCLTFPTRSQAMAWCIKAHDRYDVHGYWRFRPIRVREVITPI